MVFEQNKNPKRKLNPMDKQGKITRCVICNSKMHWAKNCPHKTNTKSVNVPEIINDDDNYDEEVHIMLMTNEYEILINEMKVTAIIDTACTKIVFGKNWFHNFLKYLDNTPLNKIKIVPNEKAFQFGDGWKVFSTFQVIIPARTGSTNCFIQTEIVDEKIPLLLSKSALKKAQIVLSSKEDWLRMFNEDIDICVTSNGHYAIEILCKGM